MENLRNQVLVTSFSSIFPSFYTQSNMMPFDPILAVMSVFYYIINLFNCYLKWRKLLLAVGYPS